MSTTQYVQRIKFIEDTLTLVEHKESCLEEIENKKGMERIQIFEVIQDLEEQISSRTAIIEEF